MASSCFGQTSTECTHGNEYLDGAAGGVWTVNVGYGRAEVADAVRDQLLQLNFFQPNASM